MDEIYATEMPIQLLSTANSASVPRFLDHLTYERSLREIGVPLLVAISHGKALVQPESHVEFEIYRKLGKSEARVIFANRDELEIERYLNLNGLTRISWAEFKNQIPDRVPTVYYFERALSDDEEQGFCNSVLAPLIASSASSYFASTMDLKFESDPARVTLLHPFSNNLEAKLKSNRAAFQFDMNHVRIVTINGIEFGRWSR